MNTTSNEWTEVMNNTGKVSCSPHPVVKANDAAAMVLPEPLQMGVTPAGTALSPSSMSTAS